MNEKHKQKGPQEPVAADASDIIVVPVWWRWDPMLYDKDKYSVEPAKDDPIWEQPEWGKPVYEHPDGWTPEPPQDKPDYPPMHYKPWEPKPEHQHHHAKKMAIQRSHRNPSHTMRPSRTSTKNMAIKIMCHRMITMFLIMCIRYQGIQNRRIRTILISILTQSVSKTIY